MRPVRSRYHGASQASWLSRKTCSNRAADYVPRRQMEFQGVQFSVESSICRGSTPAVFGLGNTHHSEKRYDWKSERAQIQLSRQAQAGGAEPGKSFIDRVCFKKPYTQRSKPLPDHQRLCSLTAVSSANSSSLPLLFLSTPRSAAMVDSHRCDPAIVSSLF